MTAELPDTHDSSPAPVPLALKSNEGLGVSVGGTVWVFDMNRRVYRERKPGKVYAGGGPIWREHWAPRKIVSETARSWVLDWGGKVPKKNADPHRFAFSEADIDRRAWAHDNKWRLVRKLERCDDYDTLLRVAAMLGF